MASLSGLLEQTEASSLCGQPRMTDRKVNLNVQTEQYDLPMEVAPRIRVTVINKR